jgi:hypothetical protein
LLQLLDEAYEKKAWHGPNLKGSLRGLTAEEAAWRPGPGRHNIWEIAVHAAYWKYAVRRRLLDDKRGSFPIKGSNWFTLPQSVTENSWRMDLALLQQEHLRLRQAAANLQPRELQRAPGGGKVSNLTLICGISSHDVYHAGRNRSAPLY